MNDASGERVDEVVHDEQVLMNSPRVPNDEAHLHPSRWWFASSGFPMIAGTIGPVANAFSILCLVRPWRQNYIPNTGADIQKAPYVDDPTWVTAINAVQLAIAVVANLFLLLNMTRRVRFSIALPVTIVGWYLSSICLIALTGTGAGPLLMDPPDTHVWSQAFYYGIYAAVLYFIVASLLVITYIGAVVGHYDKDFQLTTAQRTLMLQTIMFLIYLLLGAYVFSTIEGWNYVDAVYWADVTLFTVGFGDIYATTALGRALLIPYALIGVISLGLVIGSIRTLVLERGRRTLDARMLEKKRRKLVRRMTHKGTDSILEPIRDNDVSSSRLSLSAVQGPMTELQRREAEFNLMRRVQRKSDKRRRWASMAISTGTWVVLWLMGAKIFQECEAEYQNWSYFDAFYFSFVSLTTIGYGDITPLSNAGKSFFVFWSLLALPTMTVLISNAGDTVVKGVRDMTNQLGNITILPGERGFRKEVKVILEAISFGKLFKSTGDSDDEEGDIRELPPGFLGEAQPRDRVDDDDQDDGDNDGYRDLPEEMDEDAERNVNQANVEVDAEKDHLAQEKQTQGKVSASSSATEQPPARQITWDKDTKPPKRSDTSDSKAAHSSSDMGPRLKRVHSIPRGNLPIAVPSNKEDYRVVLIDEIARVLRHLKSQPPRQYTFPEWVWYLKLIGEDEANSETHRKAQPHTHGKKPPPHRWQLRHLGSEHVSSEVDGGSGESKEEDAKLQWSWVGSRNPLMGSQEEAEWILDKLTERLADELRTARTAERDRTREQSRE